MVNNRWFPKNKQRECAVCAKIWEDSDIKCPNCGGYSYVLAKTPVTKTISEDVWNHFQILSEEHHNRQQAEIDRLNAEVERLNLATKNFIDLLSVALQQLISSYSKE